MSPFAQEATYREIASMLTPAAVSQYLAAERWQLESRQDQIKEIWSLADSGTLKARIMLPLATDYEDFGQRFYDALRTIGGINDWDAAKLQERIIATDVRRNDTVSAGRSRTRSDP
ncbi:hypothetical protein [Actinoallomurus sp. CA-150999]|uniref:hypothetical protein n=1 Tax=Actinoallomurus sp. CA-150999 TaxID=3239887 RepID=UPI003D91227C